MDCHRDNPFDVASPEIVQVQAQAPFAVSGSLDSTAPAGEIRSETISQLLSEVGAVAARLKQQTDFPHAADAVLELVAQQGPLTVPQIARARSTSRQNVQILVDRLKKERRIAIRQNPAHKKSSLVVLTTEGKQWLEKNANGRERLLLGMGACFSAEEIQGAATVLARIRRLLSPSNADENRVQKNASPRRQSGLLNLNQELSAQPEEFPVSLL